jgi:hypothetical protein
MSEDGPYDNYRRLLAKVDLSFEGATSRYPQEFNCKNGCFSCCRSGLTVSWVEASHILNWMRAHPEVVKKIKNSDQMKFDQNFCPLLDRQGSCSIYDVRPIICRSHGAPVSWSENKEVGPADIENLDVCPLNFRGTDLESLDSRYVLSLDKLNMLLSLINRQFDSAKSNERLDLAALPNMV